MEHKSGGCCFTEIVIAAVWLLTMWLTGWTSESFGLSWIGTAFYWYGYYKFLRWLIDFLCDNFDPRNCEVPIDNKKATETLLEQVLAAYPD